VTSVPSTAGRTGAVTARAPAKLNLQLSVGPLRDDGFHPVVTIFHAVSLYDEVTVGPADQTTVLVTGEGAGSVPKGAANLAAKAAAAFARAAGRGGNRGKGRAGRGVRIEIRKRIPVAAGLAGGSADAAAVLVACNELWRAGATAQELRKVAAGLGSDVPFALTGGTAVGQGRGELVTRVLASGTYHWVLAFPSASLATPEVYAAYDRLRARGAAPADGTARAGRVADPKLSTELMAALRAGDPAAVGPLLVNDLQPATLSLLPGLRRALTAGRDLGALGAVVSGSGPTCAFLAANATKAEELAVALTGAGVCRAVVSVTGPAPGASLVASAQLR
jgi:4-diphosphocytidyl-2-C-methyl-D-erythritol kinase